MAKNLKLNIKNAQLAEALKLTKPAKKAAPKETEEAPIVPKMEMPLPEEPKASPTPVAETPPSPPPPAPPVSIAPASPPPSSRPAPSFTPRTAPYTPRPREGGGGVPAWKREKEEQQRSSYPRREGQTNNSSFSRPPYVRREGASDSRPPIRRDGPPGDRPPMRRDGPPGDRPPMRRDGPPGDRPPIRRSPMPLIREPVKEIPQQHQVHTKKAPVHSSTDKDAKGAKKTGDDRSFDSRDRQGLRDNDDMHWRKKRILKNRKQEQEDVIRPKSLSIRLPIMVKDLAVEMKLKASQLVAKLFMQGILITLNDYLDDETTVQLLGHEFECEISIDRSEEERIQITDKTVSQEIKETDPLLLQLRPPVVAFMGHVDHGKTSLIDAIRKTNVVATEAGAITQHIGAFTCKTAVGQLTILDTPGHEAFASMRERGAEVTDIAVLVVAGDEGIKTQTLEAMEQAKQAGVCLVVAINKSDKPNYNADNVYRQLSENNLLPEAWGGSVITVNCSATTGEGISNLLEMLALQAEVLELRANPSSRARGTVIESEMHKGLGPIATILVQNGTLRLGDSLVFGSLYAKIKTMRDEFDVELSEAPPSTPVKITGLSGLPPAGSEFIVVKSEKEAKDISEKRGEGQRSTLLQQIKKTTMENILQNKADAVEKKTLNLILKADVQGSLEALKNSLGKLPMNKVDVRFLFEGVGYTPESDIQFASTAKATIIGFHTCIESHAESLIKQTKVNVRLHDIIYHAVDDVRAIMLSLLDKIPQENERGEAIVKAVFKSSQIGKIAGCQVSDGVIRRNYHARLLRDGNVLWKGAIHSLKRVKEDVREVQKGIECGIVLQGFNDFKEGDTIQAYEITYLQQELT